MAAVFALAALAAARTAAADCVLADCEAFSYSGECGSVAYTCLSDNTPDCSGGLMAQSAPGGFQPSTVPPGGCPMYCGVTSSYYVPAGTACTADAVACTTDQCLGYSAYCIHAPDDTQCPDDAANHRHGVCAVKGCAYACDSGYKACGATCVPSTGCCGNTDCVSPPNTCFKTQGSCSASSTCTYTPTDGVSCNADNNACTVGDKCQGGVCVAGPTKTCIQTPCHGAPTCNTSTGNCDATTNGNGTGCGGDGCTASGTCTGGACSSPSKDCSSLTAVCKVGICDPGLPMATNCTTTEVANGTSCTIADKCQSATSCNGGECVGTRKQCAPSGPCRISDCDPASGNCVETIAPAGASCDATGSCLQNATCDATGACKGDPVLDGTPCDKSGCTASASCVSGTCECLDCPDFSVEPHAGGGADLGAQVSPPDGGGCELARSAGGGAGTSLLAMLALAMLVLRRRRI